MGLFSIFRSLSFLSERNSKRVVIKPVAGNEIAFYRAYQLLIAYIFALLEPNPPPLARLIQRMRLRKLNPCPVWWKTNLFSFNLSCFNHRLVTFTPKVPVMWSWWSTNRFYWIFLLGISLSAANKIGRWRKMRGLAGVIRVVYLSRSEFNEVWWIYYYYYGKMYVRFVRSAIDWVCFIAYRQFKASLFLVD